MKKICSFFVLLMMLAIPLSTVADDFLRGDCNEDGNVTISDVTCLINYLLSHHWPGEELLPENTSYEVGGVPFTMVFVEGGTFTMGATAEQLQVEVLDDIFPAHQVTLSNYYIGETEVTQELWVAVMGSNPSQFQNNIKCPVEMVNWDDCQEFISKLNAITGMTFRLPTEAEWEYAARGGNKSRGYIYAGSDDINIVAWYANNSNNMTHPVATKSPNELGIYDMSGNVTETCSDWYGEDYYSNSPAINPTGPDSGAMRVGRGGGYIHTSYSCSVSRRSRHKDSMWSNRNGLRLAMSCPE